MSSSCSHFSGIRSSESILHASPTDNLYNNQSQDAYRSQHHLRSPLGAATSKQPQLAHTTTADVIAAAAASASLCMQLNLDPATTVVPPHNQWNEYGFHTDTSPASWPAPRTQISRSVQTARSHSQQESWSMQSAGSDSMGYVDASLLHGLKRQNSHQRASSTSTVASNGPDSPYNFHDSYPHIANTDVPPYTDQFFDLTKETYNTHQPTSRPAYLSANYLPQYYKGLGGGQRFYGAAQDYSARSMSNVDRTSSSTPSSASEETEIRQQRARREAGEGRLNWAAQDTTGAHLSEAENRALNPQVQLSRTESAAYQDELYNPANFVSGPTPASKRARPQLTTPAPRTLVNQYLESANMARSASPNSAVSRERSPFREGSELAVSETWSSPKNPMQTAASRRQQIKHEREQAEIAAHRPQLQREPTKTISPKDALLEFNEDQPPLIQDVVPAGYRQHFGGTEPYADTSSATSLKHASFNMPPSSNQQKGMAGFRPSSGDAFTTPSNFNFSPPASQNAQNQQNPNMMHTPFQMGAYQQLGQLDSAYTAVSLAEATPQFPAQLTSMESSISDQTPALSSQDSNLATLTRPADTRAGTGTYTCTYHGCAQRFDSPALLQKHKRDFHRSQQQQQVRDTLSVEASSESPRSTASPGPSRSGLTSAQILARNSQAGPHKCTRTNPSTGKPCNTVFSRPYDLTRHEDTIHNGRKHKVRCPYCREEKTFSRNDALTRHMRVVHPDVENSGKRGRRGD